MAGRTPKPSALKLVTGNPGKRSLNKQEPDPDYLVDLTAPAWLSARAKAVWDDIAPRLSRAKLLTEVDVEALAHGCEAIANFRYSSARAGDQLVKTKTVLDQEGNPVEAGEHINPWTLVQSMSFKQATAVFAKFGMTPSDRSRVVIQPQGDLFGGNSEKDPADRYF